MTMLLTKTASIACKNPTKFLHSYIDETPKTKGYYAVYFWNLNHQCTRAEIDYWNGKNFMSESMIGLTEESIFMWEDVNEYMKYCNMDEYIDGVEESSQIDDEIVINH